MFSDVPSWIQVDLRAVSTRICRTVRDSTFGNIWYFSSVGTNRIRHPPLIPASMGIQVEDIYLHRSQNNHEAWRCISVDPRVVWKPLPLHTSEKRHNGQTRVFVITNTGLPGWVAGPTIQRKYKHQLSAAEKEKEDKTEAGEGVQGGIKEKNRGQRKGNARA